MTANIFFVLCAIDYDSGKITFCELEDAHFSIFKSRKYMEIGESLSAARESLIYRLWRSLFALSPTPALIENMFIRFLGGSIHIGKFSVYGYNAMMWAFEWRYKNRWWLFRPPHIVFHGVAKGFNWGRLYSSPNGTPSHPGSRNYYGKKQRY
jgi:hypothetical protein